jgi:hypothetical protein
MATSHEVAVRRGRVAGYRRAIKNGERTDTSVLAEAEQELAAAVLAARAEELVSKWPALTDAQIDRISSILRGGESE